MNLSSTVQLHTGRKMPILGLGTWQLTIDTAETISFALELGYRLIDTSSDYGSQPGVGEGIRNSKVNRKDIYLITKVEETDDAYERVLSNQKELGLEYSDLILIHRPPKEGVGEKLWEGLIKAKEEGIAKDIGVSNYSYEQIQELVKISGETPVVNQIEWTPFGHSDEMIKCCQRDKIVVQAYSPLTRGKRFDDPTLKNMADKYQKSPAQILIRWNLQRGSVPLLKANQKDHLKENLEVFDFEISEEDIKKLSNLNEHYSSLGSLSYV